MATEFINRYETVGKVGTGTVGADYSVRVHYIKIGAAGSVATLTSNKRLHKSLLEATMAKGEVWNQTKDLLVSGSHHIAQARFFVAQDTSKNLDEAFEMLVSLRFLGAQINNDSSNHFAVKNGDIQTNITVTNPVTVVKGSIANFHGVEGNVVNGTTVAGHGKVVLPGADWSKVNAVGFTLSGHGTVDIPVATILNEIPSLRLAALLIGNALPLQIPIELSYPPISIPIHRDGGGKPILPPNAVTPQWWPEAALAAH